MTSSVVVFRPMLLVESSTTTMYDKVSTFIGLLLLLAVIWAVRGFIHDTRTRIRKKTEERNQQRLEQEAAQRKKFEYDLALARVLEEHGVPDKTIVLAENDINSEIRIYSEKHAMALLGRMYDLSMFISANCTDNPSSRRGDATMVTSGDSRTGSIGAASTGNGGFMGSSLSRSKIEMQSKIKYESDQVQHDYTVWINVKDLINPLIEIHVGEDQRKAMEIVSIINSIATNNS